MAMIDPQIASAVQPYLLNTERVVWTGRPVKGLSFSGRDIFLVPFSVLWLGFVVYWEASVIRMGAGLLFVLFGAMFLSVGVFFLVGRFLVDAWVRQRTIYAITPERALVVRSGFGHRLLSAPLGGSVRLLGQKGDRGTLEFGPPPSIFGAGQSLGLWLPALSDSIRFEKVDNVMEAYRLTGRATS